ncbi:hypothetical protein SESBI_12076 [Sesbania bispinosa]|nr:hypothetical protein SESBI_12076 [Sesbania bispinosa]
MQQEEHPQGAVNPYLKCSEQQWQHVSNTQGAARSNGRGRMVRTTRRARGRGRRSELVAEDGHGAEWSNAQAGAERARSKACDLGGSEEISERCACDVSFIY